MSSPDLRRRWGRAVLLLLLLGGLPGGAAAAPLNAADAAAYPLLYARPDQQRAGTVVTLLLVGDTMFSRGVSSRMVDRAGVDAPLRKVAPLLRSATLAFANYEGVIASAGVGKRRTGPYRFLAGPPTAEALARAGIDLVTLANNHALDWGRLALRDTGRHLSRAGVALVGAGPKGKAPGPVVTDLGGVRVAWVAFNNIGSGPDGEPPPGEGWEQAVLARSALRAKVKEARARADLVVATVHWGVEYEGVPRAAERSLARAAVAAGADLVVGHHPHVPQGTEAVGRSFIAYSLGNFLFDQDKRPTALALWVEADRGGVRSVRGLTLKPGIQPAWQTPAQAGSWLRALALPSLAGTAPAPAVVKAATP